MAPKKAAAPPFDSKAFLTVAGEGRALGKYRKSKIIFTQGEPADAVFHIQSGKVKMSVLSEQGKEAVIAILEPGDFLGEGSLAGQPRRLATASAMTDAVLMRLEKGEIQKALRQQTEFSDKFMAHLLDRTLRVEADLVDQLFNSSEKRLARLLLLLANFGGEGAPKTTIAKISQEMLADKIGTTRSRVSFFMNKFRKLGLIKYNGGIGIEIHRSLLNVVLHEKPHINDEQNKRVLD